MENAMTHEQLEEHIVKRVHTNLFEHSENIWKFLRLFLWFAFVGLLLGGIIDKIVRKIKGENNSKWACSGALLGQVLFIGLAFWFANRFTANKTLVFDDWMVGTWQGFIFALTFFAAQSSFSDNITCVVEDFL